MIELYEFKVIVLVDNKDPGNKKGNQKDFFQLIIADISNALGNTNTETRILEVKKL